MRLTTYERSGDASSLRTASRKSKRCAVGPGVGGGKYHAWKRADQQHDSWQLIVLSVKAYGGCVVVVVVVNEHAHVGLQSLPATAINPSYPDVQTPEQTQGLENRWRIP